MLVADPLLGGSVMENTHTASVWSIIISILPTHLIILGNSHISAKSINSSLFAQLAPQTPSPKKRIIENLVIAK